MLQTNSGSNHVLIIRDDQENVQEYVLGASLHYIGRDPMCDIRLSSQFVSRRHATLVQMLNDDGSYYYRLVDGVPKGRASANGLVVNGRKMPACDLSDRDEIVFAPKVKATYLVLEPEGKQVKSFDDTLVPAHYLV